MARFAISWVRRARSPIPAARLLEPFRFFRSFGVNLA
jgi:hypothetical protein